MTTKEEWVNSFREEWMSDDQFECYRLIGEVSGGFNHTFGKVSQCGNGIRFVCKSRDLATYDYDTLTVAVVLAHDRCIRFAVEASSSGKLAFVVHKRGYREGDVSYIHPTLESAARKIRGRTPYCGQPL